jgi:hypothetical protein
MSDGLVREEDWLRNDWAKRQRIAAIANTIDYYQSCLNAVPSYPENRSTIESYLKGFDNACADMTEVLNEQSN